MALSDQNFVFISHFLMCATCPSRLILLDIISLNNIWGIIAISQSPSLCNNLQPSKVKRTAKVYTETVRY